MKTEEELLKIIHDNEYFLPFESNAYIVSVNKKDDEIEMGLNVLMASPMVGENGEIRNPHARTSRYGLMFRLKLSDLFQLAGGQAPPIRDISYTMTKLEEALKKIEELQQEAPRCPHFVANDYVHDGETAYRCAAGKCSWATGKHDEECDIVAGLGKDLKEARQEMFDLYHQACLVHPNSSEDPIREFQYDNQCMSCYEYAEDKLIEWELLKPEQCLQRKK